MDTSSLGLWTGVGQLSGLATKAFHSLYDYVKNNELKPILSNELETEALEAAAILEDLTSALKSTGHDDLTGQDNATLDGAISQFVKMSTEMASRIETVSKLLRAQKENSETLSKLDEYRTTFNLFLQATEPHKLQTLEDSLHLVRQITEGLHQLGIDASETETGKSLQWMSLSACEERRMNMLEWIYSGDVAHRHKSISQNRVEHSGQWFLDNEKYRNWVNGANVNGLLCHGNPGVGKTFITSLAIDDLSRLATQRNICVVYFYFDYKYPKLHTAENVIRSLLKQILSFLTAHFRRFESLLNSLRRQNESLDVTIFTQNFILASTYFTSVFVLVDGLDECIPTSLSDVVALICQLKDAGVKIFCTSRNSINLRKQLGTPAEIVIEADINDLRNYLSKRLHQEWRYGDYFRQQITGSLVAGMRGVKGKFLLMKFQLEYILDHENPRDAIEALKTLPTDLESTYQRIFDRIQANATSKDITNKILSWLIYSQQPLQMDELREVLSIRPGDKQLFPDLFMPPELILQFCHGFVEFDQESQIVRLAHYTVLQFLLGKNRDKLPSSVDLAKVCLTYSLFNVFNSPYTDERSYKRCKDSHKFVDHAVRFWGSYARGQGEDDRALLALFESLNSTSRCAAVHQFQIGWWYASPERLVCAPLHILAQEGLVQIYNLISRSRKLDRIPGLTSAVSTLSKPLKLQTRIQAQQGNDTPLGSLELCDTYGHTPLITAAKYGHSNMVKALLDAGADINAKIPDSGFTALHCATQHGHCDVVNILLQRRADVDARTSDGSTALLIAAGLGHIDIIHSLLAKGANVEAERVVNGARALHVAALNGHVNVVKALSKGTDLNARNQLGSTPLHLATSGRNSLVVSALIHAGGDIKARDASQCTPLHVAILECYKDTFKSTSEIRARSKFEAIVFQLAVASGSRDVINVLLKEEIHSLRMASDIWNAEATSQVDFDDFDTRVSLLSMLISLYPDDYAYPKILGDAFCEDGNYSGAITSYDLASQLNPFKWNIIRINLKDQSGVLCDACKQEIIMIWYHCAVCPLDLCGDCFNTNPASVNCRHEFFRLSGDNYNDSLRIMVHQGI